MDLPTQFTMPATDPLPTGATPTNIDLSTMSHVSEFLSAHPAFHVPDPRALQ